MRLVDLDAQFVQLTGPGEYQSVDDVAEADGVMFLCPVCHKANGGPEGTHMVLCWQPHVSQEEPPRPGRWRFEGAGYDDLTLVAGSSSVHLSGPGCGAHFFVRDGHTR